MPACSLVCLRACLFACVRACLQNVPLHACPLVCSFACLPARLLARVLACVLARPFACSPARLLAKHTLQVSWTDGVLLQLTYYSPAHEASKPLGAFWLESGRKLPCRRMWLQTDVSGGVPGFGWEGGDRWPAPRAASWRMQPVTCSNRWGMVFW